MSKHDWKPGDVALVTSGDVKREAPEACPEFETVIGVRTGKAGGPGGWNQADGHWINDDYVYDVRPLVVLDPDNREQVRRLADLVQFARNEGMVLSDALGHALRSLVAPPRPTEPTGRYAVVIDAAGEEWIKDGLEKDGACSGLWWCVDRARRVSSETWRANWDEFTPVRVLSDGVA